MKIKNIRLPINTTTSMALLFVVMLSGLLWMGCSAQAPHLKLSYSVEEQFERSRLYSGMQYYYSGTVDDPLALVALDPEVVLDSASWQPTEMTAKQLYLWVRSMQLEPWVEYNQFPDGGAIEDGQGNRIGYYYSVWKYPQIRFSATRRIEIDKPVAELRVTNRLTTDDNFGPGIH